MPALHYFAYSSNLHPLRLTARVPSAVPVAAAALPGYRLAFHKRGMDDSGKCDLVATGDPHDIAYGMVFRMAARHKRVLDRIEGGGYHDAEIDTIAGGQRFRCFTYFARDAHIDGRLRPYDWYRSLVLSGAVHAGFPVFYLEAIYRVGAIPDPDMARHNRHRRLLNALQDLSVGATSGRIAGPAIRWRQSWEI